MKMCVCVKIRSAINHILNFNYIDPLKLINLNSHLNSLFAYVSQNVRNSPYVQNLVIVRYVRTYVCSIRSCNSWNEKKKKKKNDEDLISNHSIIYVSVPFALAKYYDGCKRM